MAKREIAERSNMKVKLHHDVFAEALARAKFAGVDIETFINDFLDKKFVAEKRTEFLPEEWKLIEKRIEKLPPDMKINLKMWIESNPESNVLDWPWWLEEEPCEGEQRVMINGKEYSRIVYSKDYDGYPTWYRVRTQGKHVSGVWQTLSDRCKKIIKKIDKACDQLGYDT